MKLITVLGSALIVSIALLSQSPSKQYNAMGADGNTGASGATGGTGASGSSGATGASGSSGATGKTGATGATGDQSYSPAVTGNWPSTRPSTLPQATDDLGAIVNNGNVVIKIQAAGVEPTCSGSQNGWLVSTAGFTLCICNGTNWINRDDSGTHVCSF